MPKLTPIDRKTKPKDIQKAVKHHFGRKITYQAGLRVLNELRGDTAEQQREEFRQLSCYVDLLHKEAPLCHFTMQVDNTAVRFQRLFICPSACQSAFLYTPRFIALDGTFTK